MATEILERREVVLVSQTNRWSATIHQRPGDNLPGVVTADHRTFVHHINQPDNIYHETKSLCAFDVRPQEFDAQQSWINALKQLPEASNSSPDIRELRGQELPVMDQKGSGESGYK